MSQTKRNYKGKEYPDKTRRKWKDKKFMGFRDGARSRDKHPNPKKGIDFVNYGWPFEIRVKSVIKQKIQNDLDKEKLMEQYEY
jgi:hypothetical protein